jgi:hypothetical protein
MAEQATRALSRKRLDHEIMHAVKIISNHDLNNNRTDIRPMCDLFLAIF